MSDQKVTEAVLEGRKKQSEKIIQKRKDPEFRKMMLEKQKKIGYRTYGEGIFYKINKNRYN